jgi:hypothetical protein
LLKCLVTGCPRGKSELLMLPYEHSPSLTEAIPLLNLKNYPNICVLSLIPRQKQVLVRRIFP